MCGIAGWIDYHKNLIGNDQTFEAMLTTLENRGPDAGGVWQSPHAVLLHRRLAVVDIENGKQPMIKEGRGQKYILTYNGELYNTEDIRKELLALGHSFVGHSDTEVLLTAYIQWGADCMERLNGIYAFAVWEEREQRLFIARDRMGVKPFFYSRPGGGFVFGSELKTLLAHPDIKARITREGGQELLLLGPGRTPGQGVFADTSELLPGYCGYFSADGLRLWPYWQLKAAPHTHSLTDTIHHVRELVEDAVRRQLVSDVELCTFLSGGLDSSIISTIAAAKYREEGKTLSTFSIDYQDNDRYFTKSSFQPDSDAPWVERMSRHIGSNHHYFLIDTPQLVQSLGEATLARDLPGMADVDGSLLHFCRYVKQHATVAVSGECADEVFCGYPWYHRKEILERQTFPWAGSLELRRSLLRSDIGGDAEAYVAERYRQTVEATPKLDGESPHEARMREMFCLNLNWFMQTLLDRKDRMSMACGLEVRVPFCDHRIVEYVYNIPWEIKALGGREKGLLRRAVKGLLPDDVIERKKSPYPKTHNPRYLAAMRKALGEVAQRKDAPIFELVDRAALLNLLEQGVNDLNNPWYGQLMTYPQTLAYLLELNHWLEAFKVDIDLK